MKAIDGIRKRKTQDAEVYQMKRWIKGLVNRGGVSSGHTVLVVYNKTHPERTLILMEPL